MTFTELFERCCLDNEGLIMDSVKKIVAAGTAVVSLLALTACGGSQSGQKGADEPTEITVWAWEKTYQTVVKPFEKKYPNIKVKLVNVGVGNDQYKSLNNASAAGSGLPDVAQFSYEDLPEFQIKKIVKDISKYVPKDMQKDYTKGTWASSAISGGVYGLPMDSGPMAMFYNKEVFDRAGVTVPPKTWDEYYEAAKKIKAAGSFIEADSGDAGFFKSMVWAFGGHPYDASDDGQNVTINLTGDKGTQKFIDYWQRMSDEDLVNKKLSVWSDEWNRSLGDGSTAALLIGAWMPPNLVSSAPQAAGKWRVAPMPVWKVGEKHNSENGGSVLAVIDKTSKADAAYKFIEYASHDPEAIKLRVGAGAFPADNKTLADKNFLNATTVKDGEGKPIDYFGGQKFNEVLAQASKDVDPHFKNIIFNVYASSVYGDNISKAYYGETSFKQAVNNWQNQLKKYAKDQGFQVK